MIHIYYTIGPASLDLATEMIQAGANGARLTFSYGTPEIQLERAKQCKQAAAELSTTMMVMADLPGGGFRLGQFTINSEHHFTVERNERVDIVDDTKSTFERKVLQIPEELLKSLKNEQILIVGDGVVSFKIEEEDGRYVGIATSAGRVENNRGVTIQGGAIEPACLSAKDRMSLEHIATHDEYDAVALSFVSHAADIQEARSLLGNSGKKVIAKIETPAGVENISEIVAEADEVMVARGDLALTMPWFLMPQAVDRIVQACQKAHTPYIMATQVAESMATAPMMSRAEMTDLWQWKQSGVAGVLLSRETGWGERPVEAVQSVRTLLDVE